MNFRDSVISALRAIGANKLRSTLTMLGVVIGVGSVIAMIGIGEGTKSKSLESIQRMGTNVLMVFPNWRRGGVSGGATETPTLMPADVAEIKKAPLVSMATGVVQSRTNAKNGSKTHFTQVVGAEPSAAIIRNATKMHQGTWYTMDDEASAERKCVLGYTAYEELFGDENAVGARIRLKNQNFDVVGVIAYKGGTGGGQNNPDDQIYIPLSTGMQRLLGKTKLDMIMLQASHTDLMPLAQQQVEDILGKNRKNAGGEPLFRVMNQGDIIEQAAQQTALLSALLAGIASVSLLVGGIGIMNIMLVSVTERTREIGLRKAIGAKRESILSQFLLESVVMCVTGGTIGIGLGLISVVFVAKALKVPPIVNTPAILIAFGFSALVGLFFGLYPALRASRLQPIAALRYE